jgi:hypothetical protein
MALGDLAFVMAMSLAAMGAPLLLAIALTLVIIAPAGRAKITTAAVAGVLTLVFIGAAASTWWWWGVGFDEAERLGVATPARDRSMVLSFLLAAAAYLGVLLTGLAAGVRLLRARGTVLRGGSPARGA